MAYDTELADDVRRYLSKRPDVSELQMMGGLVFMVDDKMCIGVRGDDLMVRIDPRRREELLDKPGCRIMQIGRRQSKGFVLIERQALRRPGNLRYWLEVGLSFNPQARSSRRR